jgi:hypothetical protein
MTVHKLVQYIISMYVLGEICSSGCNAKLIALLYMETDERLVSKQVMDLPQTFAQCPAFNDVISQTAAEAENSSHGKHLSLCFYASSVYFWPSANRQIQMNGGECDLIAIAECPCHIYQGHSAIAYFSMFVYKHVEVWKLFTLLE